MWIIDGFNIILKKYDLLIRNDLTDLKSICEVKELKEIAMNEHSLLWALCFEDGFDFYMLGFL